MSLGEIFSDAMKYPLGDYTKMAMVGVLVLLTSISSVIASFGVESTSILLILSIIGFIFSLIVSGYSVGVIKNGIEHLGEIPDIDLMNNLINGIKVLIIGIVYFLIPFIIMVILLFLTGALGAGIDHVAASLGIGAFLAVIVFIAFGIFEIVALARFANTGEMGAALSIGEVIEDVKRIGILRIIGFIVLLIIFAIIAAIIASILSFIPYVGIIIALIVIGGFMELFYSYALGLLYATA